MRRDPDHAELERFLAEHGEYLLHIAIALTGSRADGEDLFQAALERLLPRWRTIASDAAASYLRRTLYNLAAAGAAAGPASSPAARGHCAAVLGAAHRGRDGRAARLLSGHGQVGHLPSAATAP